MRSIVDMDNIQIEITNACVNDCSNCTRFCGHIKKPFMMHSNDFVRALEATKGYPKMVGIMGGEPLLHPQFKEFCEMALKYFPRERLGLWTSLPEGKEHLASTIVETFGNVFINDHTRNDIYHAPILIGIEDLVAEKWMMWPVIDKCWVQNSWSASINPNGAYFCEIAAAMSLLFDDPRHAWPIDSEWWKKSPKDFREQMEYWCPRCGLAAPLKRRVSTDGRDDISEKNFIRLKNKSRKLDKCIVGKGQLTTEPEPMAAYKDLDYRNASARRYGMYLTLTEQGFCEPHMGEKRKTIMEEALEGYQRSNHVSDC